VNAIRGDGMEFTQMRPRLLLLLELYRDAGTDEARANLAGLFEEVFLAAAWNVATDLLENGWEPTQSSPQSRGNGHLRLVR
jgi:hypothetical protein